MRWAADCACAAWPLACWPACCSDGGGKVLASHGTAWRPAFSLSQAPFPPVELARDLVVQYAFSPAHFLDHAAYDCTR